MISNLIKALRVNGNLKCPPNLWADKECYWERDAPAFEAMDHYLKTILNFNGPKDEPKRPKYEPNEPKNTPIEPNKNSHEPKNEPNTDLNDIVLNLIKNNPKCSYADMIRVTGKSRITIKRLLDTLKERGVIERVGPINGGKWVIL